MLADFLLGFQTVFLSLSNILAIVVGLLAGIAVGAMPGVGSTMGVALLIPFTFALTPVQSLLLLTSVYSGSVYGGSISAILLRIPGSYEAICTSLDGYPLAKQGKAGKALGMAIMASAIGGTFSVVVLSFMAPQLAGVALAFGPAEYFALGVLGLSVITSLGSKSIVKGLISGVFGLLLATVGMDAITGAQRFTYGQTSLMNGIAFIPAVIGMFAITEVYEKVQSKKREEKVLDTDRVSAELPTVGELKEVRKTLVKSSIIGTIIGILPGVGATVAAVVGYSEAVRSSPHPEKFGTGVLEGVAASEAANNAACGGAMVPLLALGIPGSAVTAVMIGAFTIHGLQPGPLLFVTSKNLVYAIFIGMFAANILLVLGGLLGVRLFVKVLDVPYKYLAPLIMVLCFLGSFAISNSMTDVWIMFIASIVGYAMNKAQFPFAPMVLGVILGPMTEVSFRRALIISGGDVWAMLTRPITASLLVLSCLSMAYPFIQTCLKKRKEATQASARA